MPTVWFSIDAQVERVHRYDSEDAQHRLNELACSIVGHKVRRYDWEEWDGKPLIWVTCRRCGRDFNEAPPFMDKLTILAKEHMIPAIVDYVNRPSPLLTFLKKPLN